MCVSLFGGSLTANATFEMATSNPNEIAVDAAVDFPSVALNQLTAACGEATQRVSTACRADDHT